jgi:hypothetical protein
MTLESFGRAVPIHMDMLKLVGYEYKAGDMIRATGGDARKRTMREGLQSLRKATNADFGYSPSAWREFLIENRYALGYTHPYAFRGVDKAVQEAMHDPDVFAALAELAAEESRTHIP